MIAGAGGPAVPAGWEGAADELVRLEDPDGGAVAWFAPRIGANTVGFAVRRADGWAQVLHQEGPAALAERPSRFGCPILFPFPGHARDARYRWQGSIYTLPVHPPAWRHHVHGFAHTRAWRVEQSGPASMAAELRTATDLNAEERAGYPFDVRLRVSVRLERAALIVQLDATNEGLVAAPVGLGLHPYFDAAFFGVDRTQIVVRLPGRTTRVLATDPPPVPTGERRPAESPTVTVPPLGQTMLVSRTDLGDVRSATLEGPSGGPRVVLAIGEGFRDVLLFAPDEQQSISLEPHSGAPSAASQPEGHPDGLVGLAPGERLTAVATISA